MIRLRDKYTSLPVEMKATFWFLFCSMLQKGISVLTTPIFTRLLSTEQYGLVNVFSSWKEIFGIIITLKLADGIMGPGLAKEENDKAGFASSIHGLLLTLVVVGAFLFLVFRNSIVNITGFNDIFLGLMLVQMWAQATLELWAKEQRIYFRYRNLVFLTITVAIIRPLLGYVAVMHFDDKASARIIEMVAVDFFAYIGLFIFVMTKGRRFYDKKNWLYALRFNMPLVPHFLSQTILNNSDRIMIERLVNAESSGVYSLAYQISLFTILFNNALLQTISPWTFNRLKQGKKENIGSVGFTAIILIAIINIIFIAVVPELVSFFAPAKFGEAIWIIPPITMSVYFQFSYLIFTDIELYYEESHIIAIATTGGAIFNVLLNFYFIKKCGYFAAAYTTLVCYLIVAIIHYFAMSKVCERHLDGYLIYNLKEWVFISAIFVSIGFSLMITYHNNKLRYGVIIVFFLVSLYLRKHIIRFFRMIRNTNGDRK